nr:hypothetical protein CFP56_42259 [Quercus suber]
MGSRISHHRIRSGARSDSEARYCSAPPPLQRRAPTSSPATKLTYPVAALGGAMHFRMDSWQYVVVLGILLTSDSATSVMLSSNA